MSAIKLALSGALALWAAATLADTGEVEQAGRAVKLRETVAGTEWELSGVGVLRMTRFFSVYAAALYLVPGETSENVLADVPKRLDVLYLHDTPAARMIAAAEKSLEHTLSEEEMKPLRSRIDKMHAAYVDGREGGTGTLLYLPGKGTTFMMDGKELVSIKGSDFAKAYFSVWFGEHAASKSVKKQLMTPLTRKEKK